ncbi:MAG: recombinase family protein [Gaiellaceae bacterium]
MPLRAGIYARISSDRDGDNLAISRQLADCEQLAEQKGWRVVERYVDADISAYSGKPRPQYARMLEEIEAGVVGAILVYHADRLHRHPRELEDFIDLCQRQQVKLATVTGDVDLSTHEGQLIARIQGAVAKNESDGKSRRIRRKHEELAQAGRVSGGGTRPYGYDADRRTLRPDEAAIIRECAQRALAGDSLRALCFDLSDRGIPTVTGTLWKSQTLKRILVSARISGQREHRGEIVATAEWPAIITPVETQRLRAKLNDPDRRTNRSARRYLLPSLLRCHHCGAKLVSRPRDDGQRRYVCASGPNFDGCGKVTIMAEPLEQYLVEAVLHRLDSPELPKALNGRVSTDPAGEEWQAEIERAQEKLDELSELWAADEITRREWVKARAPIEKRLDTAKRRLAAINRTTQLTPHLGNAEELRQQWETMTLSRQKEIVGALLQHVVVGPGRRGFNRFDPTRLSAVWRY